MTIARWILIVFVPVTVALPALAQGRLEAVREEVRREDKDDNKDKKKSRSAGNSQWHHCDNDWNPFAVNISAPDNTSPPKIRRAFPAYPYPCGLPGYMQASPMSLSHITGNKDDELYTKWWSVRISKEDGNDFDGLNRLNGTILAETALGLGLYTSWNWYHEDVSHGHHDNAVLGNITPTWRFFESEYFLARWGVGGWLFTDHGGTNGGVNVHLSADLFPAKRWVFSAIAEGGTLGNTGISHFRASAGYMIFRGLELYGGYDFIRIGGTNLDNPFIGLRTWF